MCCEVHDPVMRGVHRLARAGLDVLVVLDGGDAERDLAREVAERLGFCLPAPLGAAVTRGTRPRDVFLEEWAARRGYRKLSLTDVAAWWHCSERQIERRLTAIGWPYAKDALGAARLIHVAGLLSGAEELSTERVANTLGFADVSTLRRLVRRMTGCTVGELCAANPVAVALEVWRSRRRALPDSGGRDCAGEKARRHPRELGISG